jgi:hypothetical protein
VKIRLIKVKGQKDPVKLYRYNVYYRFY